MSTPAPSPYAIYVEHLKRNQLAYQFSPAAGKPVFYPRTVCPYTGSVDLQWRLSLGLGTVYSTSVVYPRKGEPYNVALVDCDEGFRLMSRVQGIPAAQVAIGMRVQFSAHTPEDDDIYPVFTPVITHD